MNLSALKVSSRLYLGFGLLLVLLLGIAVFSYTRLSSLNDNVNFLVSDRYAKTVLVDSISNNVNLIARAVRNVALSTDESVISQEMDRIKKAREESNATLRKLDAVIPSEKGKALMSALKQSSVEYYVEQENLLALLAKGNADEARKQIFGAMRTKQTAMFGALKQLSDYQRALMDETVAESQETYRHACVLLTIVSAAAFALSLIAALLITRSIIRQLGGEPDYAMSIASDIASGNLARSITIRPGDQTSLIASIRVMRNRLAEIVGQVRAGTDTIATASGQIASGNLDLSSRTEQQASSLEETASAMEELTSTVKQNADNARQANQLAVSASEVAVAGGSVVSQVVETMGSINASSKKIVDIISVIDGIAFQTNILALNAAVEAARAGEQGRGFAVVATEVRNLAQRSASAAKEIKSLIDNSVTQVDTGSKLVAQAGSTMEDVVNSVKRVTDIVGEITSASQEQSEGIEQINLAITQMDEVTQQNAALVEEAAAAAQSMQEQANKLSQVVSIFKLDPKRVESQVQSSAANPRTRDITPMPPKLSTAKPSGKPALSVTQGDDGNSWEHF
ncbi:MULTISPECIES: methyl-accepting chemotaxis protein [unclassified Herbaspirillum]|uniref:methyl-accepting chemotaxis protein n=1 Tax=unclassified Herbaspirillum TaxID=2624150 RepID=UPI000E2EC8E2|nr:MULTISPECIES: methyl-accepting chemotaxis protein [unclassified Herbaspirillum]RFB68592.1 methyl-accepting chemotaxis protein [Herbaspirillum sp. 3R-3a1]TFI05499.1 methyl-accepting chemotaxis protein [Herbaspirillum sp. 3R11]TFI13591.1 methyl-accepting chemotaxis protein [Herbaspirillum sp. 3R-11]TFI27103.1 methyl-accepting chemotaxis protein [Herbaspirillum sp. 3C11]